MSLLLAAALVAGALAQAPQAESAHCPDPALSPAAQRSLCELARREARSFEPDRGKLDEILSRERYQQARKSDAGAWKALIDRLRAWLALFFESSGAQSFSQVTRFVVLTLAALLAAIGALRLAGSWASRRRPEEAPEAGPTALVLDTPIEHLARARAALEGAPREAIRQGLLALLSALEDARLARPDRVRTNRELVGELPGRGADAVLVSRVEPLMRWYDGAFYSLDPVPADGAARFVDDVERLSTELDRGRSA